jgi:hypothetical protein
MDPTTPQQNSFEMAEGAKLSSTHSEKTWINAHVREVYENEEKREVPAHLLARPQELRADTKTEKFMFAYDCFLCAIPIVLIAKTILCIVASLIDKPHQNIYIDSVSQLTIFLVNFNGQVRRFTF